MKTLTLFVALAAAMTMPAAMAAFSTGDFTEPLMPLLPPEAGSAPIYYVVEDGSVWEETNGHPGLQTEPQYDEDGNEVVPADATIVGAADLGL